ncbi:hypothetical protein OCAE111667_14365 [Occultella aeris]|uniref:Uncharacterized protein n=1 Tax=Occultella aeris TaxID=2761496 RepID=A0A7M4DIQ4_9MICO|nr:hypothetical protein [Occultella aeris]VZO36867.1 hypothetical protein HALOF300_02007 [Occultella aeris]
MNHMLKKILILGGVIVALALALLVVIGVWGDQFFEALPTSARPDRRLAWVAIPVVIALFGTVLSGPLKRWLVRDESGTVGPGITALDEYLVARGLVTASDLDVSRRGVRTSALVTAATPTGQVRDGHTQLQLDVLVARPDGSRYPVTQRLFVPASQLPRVHVGSRVATFVLPEDEQLISVGLAV